MKLVDLKFRKSVLYWNEIIESSLNVCKIFSWDAPTDDNRYVKCNQLLERYSKFLLTEETISEVTYNDLGISYVWKTYFYEFNYKSAELLVQDFRSFWDFGQDELIWERSNHLPENFCLWKDRNHIYLETLTHESGAWIHIEEDKWESLLSHNLWLVDLTAANFNDTNLVAIEVAFLSSICYKFEVLLQLLKIHLDDLDNEPPLQPKKFLNDLVKWIVARYLSIGYDNLIKDLFDYISVIWQNLAGEDQSNLYDVFLGKFLECDLDQNFYLTMPEVLQNAIKK
jgi:hypothetical protein